ncbi:UNVERIFIED_ORG: hypothetical protein J2Y81_002282 [Paraburkholderia sediminicola]|nr:hypothetical protein [Paraburkholderia sediminicola]
MAELEAVSRSRLGFEARCLATLRSLADYYSSIRAGKTFEDFMNDVFAVVNGNDDPAVEDPYAIVRLFVRPSDPAAQVDSVASHYSAMIVSCTYTKRAMAEASEVGESEQAWIYLAEASFWCGVTLAEKGIDQAYHRTVGDTKRLQATLGANKRLEKFRPVIEFAYQRARETRPTSKGWLSRNQAVQAIKADVLAFAKTQQVSMSVEQADKTIDGWLSKMPDAASLFPGKRKDGGGHTDTTIS